MRYALLLMLFLSAAAFAQMQMPGYSLDQQETDAALNELNARTFYLQTGMTPGDWAKLSNSEKEQFAARFQCKQARDQIDEQLALEHAGHVGFYNWQSLREVERRDCGNMAYRLGESPNDTYPTAYAKQQAAMMKATHGMPMPDYPIEAMRKGHQGTVMVEVHITKDGAVSSAQVEQSSGYRDLDNAAVAAAYKWHLDPARGAVQAWPVNFKLTH